MQKLRLYGMLLLLWCSTMPLQAQDSLSMEQAVQLALEQNFSIKLAQSDAEIAHLNNTRANAGLLPLVSLNASDNASAVNFQQKLANGTEIKRPLGFFNGFNTSINATWTLYDGKRMYMEKNRLDLMDDLGKAQLKAAMQEVADLTALAWLEVSRRQAILNNTAEVLKVFNDRLKLAQNRLDVGVGNKVDVLQAQIDVNRAERDRVTAENNYQEAQRNLNALLVREPETRFRPSALANTLPPLPDSTAFLGKILSTNADLLVLQQRLEVSKNLAEQTKTLNKPRVGLTGAYAFQRNDNTTGFSLFSMQHGPSVGINFTMPLYTGGNLTRQKNIALVETKRADLQVQQLRYNLRQQFFVLNGRSTSLRQALALDEKNLALAREQQTIALERFREGQSNILELREAQLALELALFGAQQTKYDIFVTDALLQAIAD